MRSRVLAPEPPAAAPARAAREVRSCAVCGSDEAREVFVKDAHRYLRCRGCGVVFLSGARDCTEAEALYDHLYARFGGFDPLTERRHQERLRTLERFRQRNRLLDVGCGAGHFLHVAKACGWQAEGTEVSQAARALGERLRSGDSKHR